LPGSEQSTKSLAEEKTGRTWAEEGNLLTRLRLRGLHARLATKNITEVFFEANKSVLKTFAASPTAEMFNTYEIGRYTDTTNHSSFSQVFIEAMMSEPITRDITASQASLVADVDDNVYMYLQGSGDLLTEGLISKGAYNPADSHRLIMLKFGSLNKGEKLKKTFITEPIADTIEISALVEPCPCLPVVMDELRYLHGQEHLTDVHIEDDTDIL
jgi:hypothetical protein